MDDHLARAKAQGALKHNPPPATDWTFHPGDTILVWREKQVENSIEEWLVPYTVVAIDTTCNIVVAQKEFNSELERYNVTQVKLFLQPEQALHGPARSNLTSIV